MKLCCIVVIDSDDPALDPATINVDTVEAVKAVRAAVVRALPNLLRVVAVVDEAEAKFMMLAHQVAMAESGMTQHFRRPPPEYRGPEDAPDNPPYYPDARKKH